MRRFLEGVTEFFFDNFEPLFGAFLPVMCLAAFAVAGVGVGVYLLVLWSTT